MLNLILGSNWRVNRDTVMDLLAKDIAAGQGNRILLVPEQASHGYELRLCKTAGDSASRYAEVLSFTRLATRVFAQKGGGAVPTLDGGGRLLAMAAAVQQLRPRLKAYAAAGAKPEFLSALVTAVDEFKSCRITPETLKTAAVQTEGSLAQKTEELALILEGYNAVCAGFGQDPQDRLTKLLEQMELTDFAETHTFYIDGFSDFTAQELEIIAHLLTCSPNVTITLVTDEVRSDTVGLELAGDTAGNLLRLCSSRGVRQEIRYLSDPELSTPLGKLRSHLLGGSTEAIPAAWEVCRGVRFSSIRQECTYVAARLRELAMSGVRYRDMALVITDPERYTPILRHVLSQFGIPAYFAGTENILHKSVIFTITTALDAVTGAQEQRDILRYLKSVLSPITPEDCDRLENYAISWSIRGKGWTVPFTKHPSGLGKDWTDGDYQALERLNQSRERGIAPLQRLQQSLYQSQNVLEQLRGLYAFLEDVDLSGRLELLAQSFEAQGDSRQAQELEQLWEILTGALEQMAALLGTSKLEPEVFVRLFKLLLSQYHVGTIPQTLDSVTVGGIPAMRRQEARHLFLLGAQEGFLPQGSTGGMVLTESERGQLMDLGIPLQADLYRQLEQEMSGIHAIVHAAVCSLTLTTGSGIPARVFRRLCRMLEQNSDSISAPSALDNASDPWEAACQHLQGQAPIPDFLREQGDILKTRAAFTPGALSPQTVRQLYGQELRLSASQVDKAASCRFAYFMRYGLGVQERKEISVDPAEFGTFVHDILERTAKTIMERGGFHCVSLEETEELATEYARQYHEERFAQLDDLSQRQNYLFQRNMGELRAVVQELWAELSQTDFVPAEFEVQFGPGGDMPPVWIDGGAMPAYLRGFVDRLDIYRRDEKTYVRVVDYKTGRKDFDYCDVLCGLGLQMLIYLFALADGGEELLGAAPEPAGVLYFPARSPVQPMDGPSPDEDVEEKRRKALKRQGLVLADGKILNAMDATEDRRFLPVKQSKSGELSGDMASPQQFKQLKTYLMDTLKKLVNQIAGGDVTPNPYFRGDHDACRFCEYSSACHLDLWGEERVYQKVTGEEFWTQIEREVNHGN